MADEPGTDSRKDGKGRKDEGWIEPELRDPLDGPMSENAYPEDMMIEIDGVERPMNDAARYWNRIFGQTDKAASKGRQTDDAALREEMEGREDQEG